MNPRQKTYRKLAGSGFSVSLRHSLWQGPDHLLWVESAVVQEQYRRFYFQDIEAVVLERTGRRTVWTTVLGILLLPFAAVALFADGVAYFSIFITAILAVLLAIQWLKGPGCKVYLQTAVQRYRLSNLVRMPKALKVMDQIRTSTETVQGPLAGQGTEEKRAPGMPAGTDTGKSERKETPRPMASGAKDAPLKGIWLHGILYGLLFFFGFARGLQAWLKSFPLAVADMAVLVSTLVLAIVLLARMGGRQKGSLLSLSAWMALGFSVIHGMAAYVLFVVATIRSMKSTYDNWTVLKNFFQLQVESQPAVTAVAVVAALVSIAIGGLGLVAVLMEKRDHAPAMRQKAPQGP